MKTTLIWFVSGIFGIGMSILWGYILKTCASNSALPPPQAAAENQSLPIFTLPTHSTPGDCQDWVQVNEDAFGLPSGGDYASEDAFEVTVYQGQLYLGMEADNAYGARVWRTKPGRPIARSQADWEQVVDEAFGNTINNDHIDSLLEFQGILYASTATQNDSHNGTQIWRSSDGITWTNVITAGFGDHNNENFKDLVVFQDQLCGGTWNANSGAEVWCTADGTTWERKNSGGFGEGAANKIIWSSAVFNEQLYFGLETSQTEARLYRTADLSDPPSWTEVYSAAAGSKRVDILGNLGGYLYIAHQSIGGIQIFRSDTGSGGSWSQVNVLGMDGNPNNAGTVIDGAALYNGALYVAVRNQAQGMEIWRTTGKTSGENPPVEWGLVGEGGLGNAGNEYAQLIPYNGYLYAWTANFTSGQKVLRTACPLCQNAEITGPGRYLFEEVGAEIVFTQTNLSSVSVCVYAGAFPLVRGEDNPIKRHYEIIPEPQTGTFTATLRLSYTDNEFAESDLEFENTTYLAQWMQNQWVVCPAENLSRDPSENTVTCSNVTTFSTWQIAGKRYQVFVPLIGKNYP